MTVPYRRAWPIEWLLGAKIPTSPELRAQLEAGLFASLPIFLGGVLNTIAVASVAVFRQPSAPFETWLALEIVLAAIRLAVVLAGRRALREERLPPVALASLLSCCWAGSVGYGAYISVASGDWLLATIVCLSAAAMVCGICLRNFGTPRLAGAMVILTLTPCAIAGALSAEPIVRVIAIQLPVFILTILSAASYLHGIMVSRMTAMAEALWMARHDVLTELPNRAVLHDALDAALARGDGGAAHALLLVDVDNFKTINDTLGHDAGDALLRAFAARLPRAAGPGQLVARIGGDEFALLITAACPDDVDAIATRIYDQLRQPFVHEGHVLHCGASMGAGLLPAHGATRTEIMKAADIALYAAKAAGRGRLRIFEPHMREELELRQAVAGAARRVVALEPAVPAYRPRVARRA